MKWHNSGFPRICHFLTICGKDFKVICFITLFIYYYFILLSESSSIIQFQSFEYVTIYLIF